MGEQADSNIFYLTYIDASGKLAHVGIRKTDTGYFAGDGINRSFESFEQWIFDCRNFLKYNYDRSNVADFKVRPLEKELTLSLQGPADPNVPENPQQDEGDKDHMAIASTTYPEGDGLWTLICDRYCVDMYKGGWKVLTLADGCNWGNRPKNAAWKASSAFVEFCRAHAQDFTRTKETGYLLLKALSVAHERIIEGLSAVWDAGTTTLIGGVLLPLDEGHGPDDPRWGFVCTSVGDCKAFVYSVSQRKAVDVTLGNRSGLDATDPGGRIGPYVGHSGEPDLRNLHLYFNTCRDGDIIILMSDGVHDNLDAYSLGLSPKEIGFDVADWKDIAEKDIGVAKSRYICKKLEEVIADCTDARSIALTLIEHSKVTTKASRVFMVENPAKKLPIDYVTYPGKMDHATVACVTVPDSLNSVQLV